MTNHSVQISSAIILMIASVTGGAPAYAPANMPSLDSLIGKMTIPNRRSGSHTLQMAQHEQGLLLPELEPGQISELRSLNDKLVTPNAFRIGLPKDLVPTLLEFIEGRGILGYFRELFADVERILLPGEEEEVEIAQSSSKWIAQRPLGNWNSDAHWLTPGSADANSEILNVLAKGGFDKLLEGFGETFDHLDSLFVYQVTIMAATNCEDGLIHQDYGHTGNRAYSVYIPILSVSDSPPELHIFEDIESSLYVGAHFTYKYEQDVGIVMGDLANHRSGDYDYSTTGQMRMAALVTLVDVTPENVESIIESMHSSDYPPREENFLLVNAGKHWTRGDHTKFISSDIEEAPKKVLEMVPLHLPKLKPGEWSSIRVQGTNETMAENAFRLGLPDGLAAGLRKYADEIGLTDIFRKLTGDSPIENEQENLIHLNTTHKWLAQRPGTHWSSNMHWVSPADEDAHNELIRVLGDIGYDAVLQSLGEQFDHVNKLRIYQITFIAVSYCNDTNMHHDMKETGNRSFNTIIPLITTENSPPEFLVKHDSKDVMGGVKYDTQTAVVLSDMAMHATAGVDYRETAGMRMAATIYSGDISEEYATGFLGSYTQVFPNREDVEYLLNEPSIHWLKNGTARLPRHDDIVIQATPEYSG